MDYTTAALSYAFLIIPLGLTAVLIFQGVYKISRNDQSGKIILGMGIVLLLLVPAVYYLLTHV